MIDEKEMFDKQIAAADETQRSIARMTAVAQRTDMPDHDYAKAFITAQYDVIMCLVEEKINLTSLVKTLTEMLVEHREVSDDLPSFEMPASKTLH